MKKRYCELMEQISLDETAKARMLERLAAGEKKHRRAPLRTALVAACVCLGVVAGALAADVIFGVPVFREVDYAVDGENINGFTTVLTDGESAETRGVPKHPETVFNPQVLEDAANSDGALEFATLEEAEAYLGVELMNNAVLDDAWYYTGEEAEPTVQVSLIDSDGALRAVHTYAQYWLNPAVTEEGNVVPVTARVIGSLYTENSPIPEEDMFIIFGYPENYTFVAEDYTAASGLNAVIVTVCDEAEGLVSYIAQFEWNGAAFSVEAVFYPEPDHALATLKQILDSFA